MTPEKISVVARRSRFAPTARDSVAVNLTSPTVVQGPMQILSVQGQQLAELNRKVEALATRPSHEPAVGPARPGPQALLQAKAQEPLGATTTVAVNPRPRIKRSRLLDLFD